MLAAPLAASLTDTPMPSARLAPSDGQLLRELRQDRPGAADALFNRYADRIRALARSRISRGLSCRVDPDDIVQSVFRRFFQAAREGRYQLPTSEELWDLLAVITLNRLRSAEQHHRAGKRDLRQTVDWAALSTEQAGARRDQGLEALLEISVNETLHQLPDNYREIVRLRMDGYEVAEIASHTARSKRTVERMLQEARTQLRSILHLES